MKLVKDIARAAKETIFQIAFIHLLILIVISLRDSNASNLNISSILDLRLIIPGYQNTSQITMVLHLLLALLFIANILFAKKRLEKKSSKK